MPKVGKKEFDYTKKGKAKAKAYAEKTGQNIEKGNSPMAYESNDARNRSQVYKEGGKVESKRERMKSIMEPTFPGPKSIRIKPQKEYFKGKEVKPHSMKAKTKSVTFKGKEMKPVPLPKAIAKKDKKKK